MNEGFIRAGPMSLKLGSALEPWFSLRARTARAGEHEPSDPTSGRRTFRTIPAELCLAVLLMVIYWLSAGPHGYFGDAIWTWNTACQIVSHGRLDLEPEQAPHDRVRGPDGRLYMKSAPGAVLWNLPWAWLDERWTRYDGLLHALVSVVPSALAATLGALAVVGLLSGYGVGRTPAFWGGVLYATGTLIWPYAKASYGEGLLAAALALCWFGLQRGAARRWVWKMALPGTALGMVLLTKPVWVLAAPLFVLWLAAVPAARPPAAGWLGRWLGFCGPVCVAGLGVLAWNWLRFHTWRDLGYGDEPGFTTPLLEGVSGLLLSPGKSIFLYAPFLILALPGFGWLARIERRSLLVAAGVPLVMLCVFAKYWAWHGDLHWGPRYLVPAVPLLFVPAFGFAVQLWQRGGALVRSGVAGLALAGVGTALLGVVPHPVDYCFLLHDCGALKAAEKVWGPRYRSTRWAEYRALYWSWSLSALRGHAFLLPYSLGWKRAPAGAPLESYPWKASLHGRGRPTAAQVQGFNDLWLTHASWRDRAPACAGLLALGAAALAGLGTSGRQHLLTETTQLRAVPTRRPGSS